MAFIKDWDIWLNYKNTIEKISKSNKISRSDFKLNTIPKLNIKSRFIPRIPKGKKVNILDKFEMKKFKSERYIDLHGYTREIDETLQNFCIDCILKKYRFVTIITGKGSGIIKYATETWLMNHPEFVVAFSGIKDTMQQVGAYAVKLRIKNNNLN